MKLLVKVLLVCSLFIGVTPIHASAEKSTSEMNLDEWIEWNAQKGIIVENISSSEVVETLALQENKSIEEISEEYDINPKAKTISDFYKVKFEHDEAIIDIPNTYVGTTVTHTFIIKLYTEGSFREILDVYNVTLEQSALFMELQNINIGEPHWDGGHVSAYSSAELICPFEFGGGITAEGVFEVVIGGVKFYKKNIGYGDTFTTY